MPKKSEEEIKATKIALMASLSNLAVDILKHEHIAELVEPILKKFIVKELTGSENIAACQVYREFSALQLKDKDHIKQVCDGLITCLQSPNLDLKSTAVLSFARFLAH